MTATDGLQYSKCAVKLDRLVSDDYHHVPLGWNKFMGGYKGGYNTLDSTVKDTRSK